MDNNINIDKTTGEVTETNVPSSKYTLEYALMQIERIANDTAHLEKAFEDLKIAAQSNKDTPCGGSNDKVAAAIGDSVKCRETTNQKLIEFYSRMVDDLKPSSISNKKVDQSMIDFVRASYGSALDAIMDADYDDDDARNSAFDSVIMRMNLTISDVLKNN